MNSGFETNVTELFEKFVNLTNDEITKTTRSAINTAARKLKKETVSKMNASIVNHSNKGQYIDDITDAVRIMKIRKNYDEDLQGGVHILGTNKKGSGTFRARFLEKGTVDRYIKTVNGVQLKKPKYIGRINGKWFFRSANEVVGSNIESIYMKQIEKSINKINNTKL